MRLACLFCEHLYRAFFEAKSWVLINYARMVAIPLLALQRCYWFLGCLSEIQKMMFWVHPFM